MGKPVEDAISRGVAEIMHTQRDVNMENSTLVMVTIHEPPYQIIEYDNRTGEVRYAGLCFEILNALSQQLGFSYTVVQPPDGEWGVELPNGTYTGMIGMIVRGDADIGIGAFTITSDRRRVVDFLQPFWEESMTYMMRKNPTSTLSNCFKPFTIEVWICCLTALFLMALVHWIFGKPWANKPTTLLRFTKKTIVRVFEYHMTAMKQPLDVLPRLGSLRALLACWWLYCLVIAAVYSGNLVAIMSFNIETVPIRSLDDLANQSHTPVGLKKGVAIASMLKNSQYPVYQRLWRNIDVHYSSENEVMEKVTSGDLIIIQEVTILKRQLWESTSCDLALGQDFFHKSNFGFPVRKNFDFTSMINPKILQIVEGGLLEKWQRKYWRPKGFCSKITTNNQRASLVDTFGALVILTIGIGVALITLLVEANLKCLKVLDSA